MKALITGMNGTVAPVLGRALASTGTAVRPWDRSRNAIDSLADVRHFIETERPDLFCHLATGSPDWAEWCARVCAELEIPFLFTSSVSVFGSGQQGPFGIDADPQPTDDYGRYKLDCERRVRAAHPEAWIVRLGWQIGTAPGGNHMVDYLHRTFAEQGRIDASVHWFQACSFLEDTASVLAEIVRDHPSGLYHLDGNPGLSFHDIVLGLNGCLAAGWTVEASSEPSLNNLMPDPRLDVPSVMDRLSRR